MRVAKNRIVIANFGSQYTELLARRFRSPEGSGVMCEIISPEQLSEINANNCAGVVLSGGPRTVSSITEDEKRIILDQQIPVLGICYGMQLIGFALGATVSAAPQGEFGPMGIHILDANPGLFSGLYMKTVWMSHNDEVKANDMFFKNGGCITATSEHSIAAIQSNRHRCYGVQFHPEVQQTQNGVGLLRNFVTLICGLPPDTWNATEQLNNCLETIRSSVTLDDRIILGLSGGVDSAVVAGLLMRTVHADDWLAVYVDHGMMRAGETEAIKAYAEETGMPFKCIDRSKQFLDGLRGVIDAEQKRKIVGRLFIEAFEEAAREFEPTMLAQGTIYPDIVESAKGSKNQHLIKSHHNVGGLPETLGLKLLEPLKMLFKDEVRAIATKLNLPESIVQRPPFPGPGLSIRIIGQQITPERIAIVQQADAVFHRSLAEAGFKPSQFYAALLPGLSVGVVGDRRRLGAIISLRAVSTDDFMTASVSLFESKKGLCGLEFLQLVGARIVNECADVARVMFDITPKPPGTIELE